MSKGSHVRSLLVVLVLVVACAGALYANHSWGGYHWARTSNPFTLLVGDNVNSTWDPYLNEAISDWSASSVLDLSKVAGGTRPKNCRPTAGRIEACNATYGNTGWLGIAQIWITGGTHITQAITKVNDTYFNTATYNTPAWRRLVMCQEIAHDFGLDHQDENFNNGNLGSCMDYTNDPDGPPSNEHPNSHDFAQIEAIYAHLDSTTTIGTSVPGGATAVSRMPPAMRQLDLAGIGQWGRLIRVSQDGFTSAFELDFGYGDKVITYVVWADDEAAFGSHDH